MALAFPGLTDELRAISGSIEMVVRAAVERAYKQGYRDGSTNMRDAIMKASETANAADTDVDQTSAPDVPAPIVTPTKRKFKGRVLKGSIGEAVDAIFEVKQGLTVQELHTLVNNRGISASKEGVGVQLRRNEGSKYRRSGLMWFPLVVDKVGTVDSGSQ